MLMLNAYLLIDATAAAALIILAAIVLTRNNRTELNRTFALFNIFIAGWIVANYFSNDDSMAYGVVLFANHATLFFSFLSLIALNHFLLTLTKNPLSKHRQKITGVLAFTSLTALTPFVVKSASFDGNVSVIEFGWLTPIYFLGFFITAALIFYSLTRGIRKSSGIEQVRIKVIFYGALITIGVSAITNAILPAALGFYGFVNIGTVSTLALIFALYYAIAKHSMFDIRLIVARSIAYLFLVSALAALYTSIIIIPLVFIIPDYSYLTRNAIPFIAALFVAGSAPYLKRFFDKQTNRLFYRDAYEPQVFLDQLNKALVGEIEMQKLLTTVTKIMETNLKSSYVAVGVKETENRPLRVMGENAPKYKAEEIMYVRNELQHSGKRTVIATDLATEKHKLQEVFRKNDIDIIVRLLTSYDTGQEAIAYLILGPKKSGNIYNKQDIQILGIIADELVIAIQNALRFEEIQEFAVTLQQKVDEATARLRRTNEKLKELDDTKDEFISMASHQLRTPLTSVKGYLSMVLEGDAGAIKPQQKQLLEQSFLSAQRMVYIIADLLNVSRLKTGKFVLDINPTDLTEVIKGEIDQLKEAFRAKKLAVEFDKPKEFPALLLDETKTRQVIMNFIDNAIYYTPAGGRIDVSLTQDKKHTYFRVKDTGLGVPKTEQGHLFTKFYRATNARKARPDGTGLGLFMAKKVIVAQGGTILFESQEGKGSTFGFCFETAKLIPASTEKPQEAAKV